MRVGVVIAAGLGLLVAATPAHAGAPVEDFACAYVGPEPRVLLTQGKPPQGLIDELAVLRRPHTPGDFLPDFGARSSLDRLHLRYVRRTPGEVGADRHYVVTGNFQRTPARPPRQCLRGLSARARRHLLRGWREQARRPTDALCLFEYQGDGMRLRENCVSDPVETLKQGLVVGPVRTRGRLTHVAGIVPDGVVTVEARYRKGPARVARVVDNVWSLTDLRRSDRLEPDALVWLDAAGAPIKRFRFDDVAFSR